MGKGRVEAFSDWSRSRWCGSFRTRGSSDGSRIDRIPIDPDSHGRGGAPDR